MVKKRTIGDANPFSIVFPLWLLILRNVIPMIVFVGLGYYDFGRINLTLVLIVTLWILLFYLIGQYSYLRVEIYSDRIKKVYLGSLYLKNQEYLFSDIERFFFQFHVGTASDPYVRIDLNNGKRKKIRMPKKELHVIKGKLSETVVPIIQAKYAYHRP